MKLVSGQSMKKIQLLRSSGSCSYTGSSASSSAAAAVAIVVGGRKTIKGPLGWCSRRSYVPKKWVYKFRAQCKKAIGWRRSNTSSTTSTTHYSYDMKSYALNFDDGTSCM